MSRTIQEHTTGYWATIIKDYNGNSVEPMKAIAFHHNDEDVPRYGFIVIVDWWADWFMSEALKLSHDGTWFVIIYIDSARDYIIDSTPIDVSLTQDFDNPSKGLLIVNGKVLYGKENYNVNELG